ncbi:MAG: Do family serine endopeptidase [Pseudomonadota bacterium]
MPKLQETRSRLYGGIAVAGLAAAFIAGGSLNATTPVLADAVKVQAPQAPSFADVVEAVSPAVVSVKVAAKVRPASNGGNWNRSFGFDNLPDDHPLKRFFERNGPRGEFFGQRRDRRGDGRRGQRRGMSQGSGFFVSEDGYIVTNNHVIRGGSDFTVVLNDGEEISATLVGTDPKTDLAVLKVEDDREFTYVKFAESKSRVGEWVVAVGNPFGLGGTVTAGIVSASNRDIGSGPYDDFIQIDAAVNKGNSGGPAFNLSGEVIGVNTAIFSPSGGNVGIAFAISAKSANEVVKDLIDNGSVTRGWLGVQIQPVTQDIAESLGLAKAAGAIVADAQTDSPAAKGGIRSGDVILKVDGKDVQSPRTLAKTIAAYEPNAMTKITVFRDGREQVLDVELGTLPRTQQAAMAQPEQPTERTAAVDLEELGMAVAPDGGSVVVSDVMPGSIAAKKGVRAGDEIISINGRDTRSVRDVGRAVARAMEDERKAILFQFRSGERNRFVALPIAQG